MTDSSGRFKGKYDFFTIYFIPGITVLLASHDSFTDTNLSVLGNTAGYQALFTLWGFTTGIYYCTRKRAMLELGQD